MRDFRQVLPRLQAFQKKFESLLASARMSTPSAGVGPTGRPPRLRELTSFGRNPGELRMFVYTPEHLRPNAPLVIALHGCTQTAEEYDHGTGWSSLADNLGFAVVYPQQQPTNNAKNCFSWFLRGDTARGQGEALSIREMVDHAIAKLASDRRKVFVTGLSAGGAMASVMLATYPEIFAGGAILAGLPYGCANNVQQAFDAMFTDQGLPAQVLGDRVRTASKHCGPWPKLSVWHGTSDPIVKPSNSEDIIRQWTNVHGLADRPSYQRLINGHSLRVWSDENGEALIEAFAVSNMSHGVPLATTGSQSCGNAGAFFLDVGISSTHHIARFWRLDDLTSEVLNSGALALAPTDHRTGVVDGAMIEGSDALADVLPPQDAEDDRFPTSYPVDPNAVIAAAFKAAGLAVPEGSTAGSTLSVAPGPIIAAALKAAGMSGGVPDDG